MFTSVFSEHSVSLSQFIEFMRIMQREEFARNSIVNNKLPSEISDKTGLLIYVLVGEGTRIPRIRFCPKVYIHDQMMILT